MRVSSIGKHFNLFDCLIEFRDEPFGRGRVSSCVPVVSGLRLGYSLFMKLNLLGAHLSGDDQSASF